MFLIKFIDAHEVAFRRIGLALRIIIGAMLVASGTIKALDNRTFIGTAVGTYGYPDGIYQSLTLMAPLEIITGVSLLLGFATKVNTWVILGIFAVFSGGLLLALHKGGVKDCGCFGSYVPMSPAFALGRNLVLMLGTGLLCLLHRRDRLSWKTWQVAVLLLATSVTGVAAGWSTHKPLVDQTLTKVGKVLPTWGVIQGKPDLAKGDAVVVFFSPDCPHCWSAAANIRRYVADGGYKVVGFTSREPAKVADYMKRMDVSFPTYRVTSDFMEKAVDALPTFLVLRDGKVIFKEEGTVPAPRAWKEWIVPDLAKGGTGH